MTALTTLTSTTVSAIPSEDATLLSLPWRRMVWVTWRQHRTALVGVAALLSALALYLWIVGLRLHHSYAVATACHPTGSIVCGDLPGLIGAFVGAPVLAREMETGTFRYAWTQGFGRRRWTLAKLVLLGLAVTTFAGAISVLFSWYYQPYFAAGNQTFSLSGWSPLAPGLFDLRGVAFASWTLAAFAIGGLAGMLIRRVVPAIAASLAAYSGLAIGAAGLLRRHYLAPLVTGSLRLPGSAWILSQDWFTKSGHKVSQSALSQVLQKGGPQLAGKGGIPSAFSSWDYLVRHGYMQLTTFQPASRFWAFQWIEGGWLLALSILLIAVTLWLVRRRAA
jgi:hypothetical protein